MSLVAKQKFLFDNGAALLSIPASVMSQALMILVASDKLKIYTGIQHTRTMILLACGIYVFAVVIVGNILDYLDFWKHVNKVWTDRVEAFKK